MRAVGRFPPRPGQAIAGAFALAIAAGAAALSLPWATRSGQSAPLVDAVFTATSAVCVTGLASVDTPTFWSPFGQVVILVLIQVGGLGIMTIATLVAVVFFQRMGLRARMIAQAETKALTAEDLRGILRRIAVFVFATEAVIALVLFARFVQAYDLGVGDAAWRGAFHSVSAFNNAGFALYSDNLVTFVDDAWILMPVAIAVVVGGLGFPVVFEIVRRWRRPGSWSVLARVTVGVTAVLLLAPTAVLIVAESGNDATLGGLGPADRAVAAFFTSAMTRTAGFNAVDIAELRPESLFLTDILMFIGGGSAGTAGGIKVTTFGLLAFVVLAEIRGRTDVIIGRRAVPLVNQRQALSVAVLSSVVVVAFTLVLMALTPYAFDAVVFESVSAFATVGLSMGITPGLSDAAKALLVALMYIGRIGPVTFASALAARDRSDRVRLPEERMVVG